MFLKNYLKDEYGMEENQRNSFYTFCNDQHGYPFAELDEVTDEIVDEIDDLVDQFKDRVPEGLMENVFEEQ